MTVHRLRWWLAVLFGLLWLLAPACSRTERESRPAPARPAPGAAAPRPADQGAAPAPKRAAATGPVRRHPFAPLDDPGARRARSVAGSGPLALKGICGAAGDRTAIIQEGRHIHFLRVNETLGGLTVLAIRAGEVVLGAGHRRRVLSLYDD